MTRTATKPDLQIRGPVEIHPMHWALWAERARGEPVPGPILTQVHLEPRSRDLHTVRQLYDVAPRDDDIAEAIGQGVERLHRQIASKALAVRSRWVAWSEHVAMKTLAKRFGVSPARVSQMADEGETLVERWVREEYGDG